LLSLIAIGFAPGLATLDSLRILEHAGLSAPNSAFSSWLVGVGASLAFFVIEFAADNIPISWTRGMPCTHFRGKTAAVQAAVHASPEPLSNIALT